MARVQRFEYVCDVCHKTIPAEDENNFGAAAAFYGDTTMHGERVYVFVRVSVGADCAKEVDVCLGCVNMAIERTRDGRVAT